VKEEFHIEKKQSEEAHVLQFNKTDATKKKAAVGKVKSTFDFIFIIFYLFIHFIDFIYFMYLCIYLFIYYYFFLGTFDDWDDDESDEEDEEEVEEVAQKEEQSIYSKAKPASASSSRLAYHDDAGDDDFGYSKPRAKEEPKKPEILFSEEGFRLKRKVRYFFYLIYCSSIFVLVQYFI
jgi:hypothetical protein